MKEVISQIKSLTAGDLVQVEWCDASIGKSLSNGVSGIDVPVKELGRVHWFAGSADEARDFGAELLPLFGRALRY